MPTYEYECRKCGHYFEKFQSMTEARIKTCPVCKGRVDRLIGTGAGIIFKGSGFYETDYRSDSYQQAAKEESTSSSSGKEADQGTDKKKTETKAETPKGDNADKKTAQSGKGSTDA